MATIFTDIVQRKIPSYKIDETDDYYAFLDINPLSKGHTLVIPKREVDYLFDIEDDYYAGLLIFAKRVARAIEKTVPCKRMGMTVIGLEVPHAHIHLIPINTIYDMDFKQPKLKLKPVEFEEIAKNIRKNLD